MILHKNDIPFWRWKNFSLDGDKMLSCPCCGEFYFDPDSMDRLQAARKVVGKPFKINSGHRCEIHNAIVGGAPLSMHKKIAFDISLDGHNKKELLLALIRAGFCGIGLYQTFIHADMGRKRSWYGNGAEKVWKY